MRTHIAGWSYPTANAKMHYFAKDDKVSLCGIWMILNLDPKRFHQDPELSARCKACTKKLETEQ